MLVIDLELLDVRHPYELAVLLRDGQSDQELASGLHVPMQEMLPIDQFEIDSRWRVSRGAIADFDLALEKEALQTTGHCGGRTVLLKQVKLA